MVSNENGDSFGAVADGAEEGDVVFGVDVVD